MAMRVGEGRVSNAAKQPVAAKVSKQSLQKLHEGMAGKLQWASEPKRGVQLGAAIELTTTLKAHLVRGKEQVVFERLVKVGEHLPAFKHEFSQPVALSGAAPGKSEKLPTKAQLAAVYGNNVFHEQLQWEEGKPKTMVLKRVEIEDKRPVDGALITACVTGNNRVYFESRVMSRLGETVRYSNEVRTDAMPRGL